MRFSLLALPAFAVVSVQAAAVTTPAKDKAATTTAAADAGPQTLKDRDAALSSVLSSMMQQSPSPKSGSQKPITVTGNPTPTGKPAATTSKPKTTTKASLKPTTTTASSKKSSTTTSSKGAAATPKKNAKRQTVNDACAVQPIYYNYAPAVPSGATDAVAIARFLNDTTLYSTSNTAAAPTGYSWLYKGFLSSQNRPGYMFMTQMTSYNQTACAAICTNTPYCKGFSIYYERSPTLAPAASCANPTAFTSIRCTYYDGALTSATAVNYGEWRQNFAVVITGANAYNRVS